MPDNDAFRWFHGADSSLDFSTASVDRLEAMAELIKNPPQFEPGQLVKPRPSAPLRISGPCVVMEMLAEPIRYKPRGRQLQGYLFDMRIGTVCTDGHIHPLPVELWMFEPYAGLILFGAAQKRPTGLGLD